MKLASYNDSTVFSVPDCSAAQPADRAARPASPCNEVVLDTVNENINEDKYSIIPAYIKDKSCH